MLKAPTYHLGEGYYVDSEPDLTSNEENFKLEFEEVHLTEKEINSLKKAMTNIKKKVFANCVFYILKKE